METPMSGLSGVWRLVSLGRKDSPFCRSRWTQVTKIIRPPGLHTRCISDINLGHIIAHDCPCEKALCYLQKSCEIKQRCIILHPAKEQLPRCALVHAKAAKSSCMVYDMQSMQSILGVCARGLWFLWHVFAAFQRPDQIEGVVSKGHPLSRQKTRQPFLSLVQSCNQRSRNWTLCGFWKADLPRSQITIQQPKKIKKVKVVAQVGMNSDELSMGSRDRGITHSNGWQGPLNCYRVSAMRLPPQSYTTHPGLQTRRQPSAGKAKCHFYVEVLELFGHVSTVPFWIQRKSKAVSQAFKDGALLTQSLLSCRKRKTERCPDWLCAISMSRSFWSLLSGLFSLKALLPALAALDSKLCLQQLRREKHIGLKKQQYNTI